MMRLVKTVIDILESDFVFRGRFGLKRNCAMISKWASSKLLSRVGTDDRVHPSLLYAVNRQRAVQTVLSGPRKFLQRKQLAIIKM